MTSHFVPSAFVTATRRAGLSAVAALAGLAMTGAAFAASDSAETDIVAVPVSAVAAPAAAPAPAADPAPAPTPKSAERPRVIETVYQGATGIVVARFTEDETGRRLELEQDGQLIEYTAEGLFTPEQVKAFADDLMHRLTGGDPAALSGVKAIDYMVEGAGMLEPQAFEIIRSMPMSVSYGSGSDLDANAAPSALPKADIDNAPIEGEPGS